MKNIIIFLQTKKNDQYNINDKISIFIENYKEDDKLLILRDNDKKYNFKDNKLEIIEYKEKQFNFCNIVNIIKNYDMFLYSDDTYDILQISKIYKDIIKIGNNLSYLDIIYFNKLENFSGETELLKYYGLDLIKSKYNYQEDMYHKYELMKQIFTIKDNPYENKFKKKDYINYYNKLYDFEYKFKFEPSLVKTSVITKNENYFIFKNKTYENSISINILDDYCSYYLNYEINRVFYKEIRSKYINNIKNLTIVTGYLKLPHKRPPKKNTNDQIYEYMDKCSKTLSIDQNMVIFISEDIYEDVYNFRKNLNLLDKTKIIKIDLSYLYKYESINELKTITERNIKPYNDPYYILAVNTRYKYMKESIENNYFDNDYFCWLDFSASHIVDINENFKFNIKNDEQIRVGWIARMDKEKNFVFNHKALGGGVFGGYKNTLLEFIKIHDKEFNKLLEKGYMINDDRLLFFIYEKYPDMFNLYFSSYKNLVNKFN